MEEHPQARQIIDTLTKAGFIAYYAGGWVRDYLLQHPSDDIDIATNAQPETIQALFPRTVPIGLAFGIILVLIDDHEYEVATFRQDLDYQDGRRPSRVEFTSAIEDAKRRDFTINGMFYDPIKQEILDYVEGRKDLEKKVIRAIGNPHERIREDRLRMIRAIRLACRFKFTIEAATQEAIRAHAKEIFPAVAIERIVQELTKAHQFQVLKEMLIQLHSFDLLTPLFPHLKNMTLSTLKEHLAPTENYPKEAPVISFLLTLFPSASLKEQQTLCKTLKLPNADLEFVSFLFRAKNLIEKEKKHPRSVENFDFAYLYANPLIKTSLAILSAQAFTSLEEHTQRQQKLHKEILRIQDKNPVVKADILIQYGISPGPTMGNLLRSAEKIAINEGIEDPLLILSKLGITT